MKIEKHSEFSLAEIVPYEQNSKLHTPAQVAHLAKSLSLAVIQPIVVDENNVIIKGHGRYLAAKELGRESMPVWRVLGLSEAQKIASRIADNKIQSDTGFDREVYDWEIEQLIQSGFDVNSLNLPFDVKEITGGGSGGGGAGLAAESADQLVKQIVLTYPVGLYEKVIVALDDIIRNNAELESNTDVAVHLLRKYANP